MPAGPMVLPKYRHSFDTAVHNAKQQAHSSLSADSPRSLLATRFAGLHAAPKAPHDNASHVEIVPATATAADADTAADVTIVLHVQHEPPRFNNSAMRKVIMGSSIGLLLALAVKGFYDMTRMLIATQMWAATPLLLLTPLGLFFFSYAICTAGFSAFLALFSPLREVRRNSSFFSAIKTNVPKGAKLPPIVVQMPVYKEPLHGVIDKSYFNVKLAIDDYISKGGSAKFLISDDGLQVVGPEEKAARIAFYSEHNIAYVGRPPTGRRGVFKKASNLNYSLYIANTVNKICKEYGCSPITALARLGDAMKQVFLADGDVTIADDAIILLIDADTKVPLTCMHDTMGEFITSPNLPYTQHLTAPFDEQKSNYWEGFISHFTEAIYFLGIAVNTALGDTAPLVGHNLFLRWSSMQAISYVDDEKRLKYWSENSVSEDFDLYMKLASKDMFGRYVTYTGTAFQEGISLTYIDEVKKMRKFAYGTCELIFHPLHRWLSDGVFAPQMKKYMCNPNILWHRKASLLAYMSSYLAMAAGFPLMIMEGTLVVFANEVVDIFLTRSFYVMITCVIIFAGLSLVSNTITMIRYNPNNQRWWQVVWGNIKWVPISFFYFNSILFPMTTACLQYFLGAKVVWGATVKDTAKESRLSALATTLYEYRWQYALMLVVAGAYSFAVYWKGLNAITAWGPIAYSLGHMLGLILMNPAIMTGSS